MRDRLTRRGTVRKLVFYAQSTGTHREAGRQTQAQTDAEADRHRKVARHTDRQTDRGTHTHRGIQTDTVRQRQHTERGMQRERQTDRRGREREQLREIYTETDSGRKTKKARGTLCWNTPFHTHCMATHHKQLFQICMTLRRNQ